MISDVCWDGSSFKRRPDTVDPGYVSAFPFHTYYNNRRKEFSDISKFTIPVSHSMTTTRIVRGVTILFGEYNAENFGLVLNDSVLPWFKMLYEFGLSKESVTGVVSLPGLLRFNCADRAVRGVDRQCNRNFLNGFSQHLFGVDVQQAVNLKAGTCFESVVVGMGLLSDHGMDWSAHGERLPGELDFEQVPGTLVSSGVLMRSFRSFLLGRQSVSMDKTKMVVVPRTGKKGIVNMDDLVNDIAVHHKYHVTTVDPSTISTIKEQLDLFSDAAVVVVTTGGGALIAQVVPDGATIVLISPRTVDYEFWYSLSARLTIIPVMLDENNVYRNYIKLNVPFHT